MLVGPAADQFDRISVLCGVVLCGALPSLLMSLMVPSSKAGGSVLVTTSKALVTSSDALVPSSKARSPE